MTSRFLTTLSGLALLTPPLTNAAVNDIFPADFVALPAGTNVITTYAFDKTSRGPYAAGQQIGNWQADTQTAALRYARFFEWQGLVWAGSWVGGYTRQSISGDGLPDSLNRRVNGSRDMRFNATAWLVNDPVKRDYLATNLTWMLPSGAYQGRQMQNTGENQHQVAASLAWLHGIGQRWNVELIGELAWYSANTTAYPGNVRLEKALTQSLTSYARYDWGNGNETYLGYEWNRGGALTLDGVSQNNPASFDRLMAGAIIPLSPTLLLNLRAAKDLNVANGFAAQREIAARFLVFY